MNDKPTTQKLCTKCKVELVQGYCPVCYPFPRIFCRGCKQPLTSIKHRARGIGARCYAREQETERNARLKEEVPFEEFINRMKYKEMGDMF